jgi:hypothetical protein
MALTPATTTWPDVPEFQEFSQSVSYMDEVAGDPETGSGGSSSPATVISVTSSLPDNTIIINFQNNIVTVSGKYSNAFPEKKFSYIPTENKQALITVSFDLVPSSIYTLITFTPASTNSREITYTVVTSAGTATITQNVTTSWDVGKAQMYDVLARGEL